MLNQREALRNIRTFPQLVKFLRDELEWPIESEDFEELTFDYTPEELGIDTASAAKIQEIKRLRPLTAGQPWGIFFVKFEPKRLPVVALRRVLGRVVLKKRASANSVERAAWQVDDLLFISSYGESAERQISFAHFSQDSEKADLPTLKVLGWDNRDTPLHLDDVAETLHKKLTWPEDDKDVKHWRAQWRSAFTLRHLEVITTSMELAVRLADLARAIRARIQMVLAIETQDGPLTKLMKAFQQALIHDLTADDFADMYAQTIAYGLLSARVANPAHGTADAIATHIPVTNPFLKELMETFLHAGGRKRKERGGGIDFDELGVSEVVELLDAANMEAVVLNFGDRNRIEDPVIYFYELFLKEYDAKKRMDRGVFYTPQPVVSYIVRSIHELLQTEFGLDEGLASTATWGDMAARDARLKVPDGVSTADPFIVILDPATGTATFLVEVIDVIYLTLVGKWQQQGLSDAQQRAAWNEYVPKHLLPRLHGYELLMAPYAIAHLKIGLKLFETGYSFDSDERARIYLTNALEPSSDDKKQREFEEWAPALAHEAKAVNAIKSHQRFTVVIGNPPYNNRSENKTSWIMNLIEIYKKKVRLEETQIQALSDDYVKFLRLADWNVSRVGVGVIGMITNNGYLDGHIFRDLRDHFVQCYSSIRVINLHGDSRKKERAPDGSLDKNVFDIMQGVSILVLGKNTAQDAPASVLYDDVWGDREAKYEELSRGLPTHNWTHITSQAAAKMFLPAHSSMDDWEAAQPLAECFGTGNWLADKTGAYGSGFKSQQDEFALAFTARELTSHIEALLRPGMTETELRTRFALCNTTQWNFSRARERLPHSNWRNLVQRVLFRPFDFRFSVLTADIVTNPRREIMGQLERPNLALLATRKATEGFAVFITRVPCGHKIVGNYDMTTVFPIYRYTVEADRQLGFAEKAGQINLSPHFVRRLDAILGGSHELTPEAIIHYAYDVFHSPGYRSRYAEHLKIDFPRLPLTSNVNMFRALERLGGELTSLHLMESPKLDEPLASYSGAASPEVDKVSYAREAVWLDSTHTCGFRGVSPAVWNFHIGSYRICEKWLKDRKGRVLSEDDIDHYRKIIVALSQTIRLMQEIDEVIEAHGGWPGAFQSTPNPARAVQSVN